MDTPTHPFSNTVSKSSTAQSHTHHNVLHNSPGFRRNNHPYAHRKFHTPITRIPQQLNISPWRTSSASKYASLRLIPLISKFEALDANSLTFSIRDAQPPHLRLPRSRMGRRNTGEDVHQMKTTRERLLTLFDRPGWGARTLRGFRDGGSSRGYDDIPIEKERGPSRTQKREVVDQSRSPQGQSNNSGWVPEARPRGRRESRIRDKIRLFDGDMDFPPSSYKGPWKLNDADDAVPSQSPTKCRPRVSPTKPGLYSVFPPEHHTGTLTPIKSYGYLRPKEITPLPWRPLDSRRWETVAQLTNNPGTLIVRGQPRERAQRSLITPAPTNAASAVKKVQIIYQDPKRNISEKVSVLCAAISKEREQEHFKCEVQEKSRSSALSSSTQAFPIPRTAKKHGDNEESAIERKGTLETNGAKSVERLKPARESKIQDRINLFSNKGPDVEGFGVPLTRMRNQSTPTKLPSQVAHGTPSQASSRVPQPNPNTKSQVEKHSTEATAVMAANVIASDVLLETVSDQQGCQPQTPELATHAPAPRKSSGISDKIQHFEAFSNGQAASIGSITVDNNRKRPSSQLKRIQTWPIPASENVFHRKIEQIKVLEKSVEEQHVRQEVEKVPNSTASSSTKTEKDKVIKRHQDRERARYKIHSRQERLNRRSRSRSRSAPSISISGLSDERKSEREAFKQLSERFPPKEAREMEEMELEIPLNIDSYAQRPEHETVQEIWIGSSEDGPSKEVVVVDTVIAQCELAEPRPMRLAETLRMIRLCRGRFGERSGTWRRKLGGSSEKGVSLAG